MQSPSSLIFLVLLGVWAAYFVQYWVRRRDHVATARSVEQFSTAMRVLERRDALPRTDLSEPAPRSYAVHPARAARPQVMVKRALAAAPPAPGTVTERIGGIERPKRVGADRPGHVPTATTRPAGLHAGPATLARPASPARPAPEQRLRPSRRVRGLLLLVALVELVAIVALVAASMLPAWALLPALLAPGAALAFVRSGVRTEAALARSRRRRRAADLERRRAAAPVAVRPPATRRATPPIARRAPAPAVYDEALEDDRTLLSKPSPSPEPARVVVASSVVERMTTGQAAPLDAPAPIPVPPRAPASLLAPVLEGPAPAAVAAGDVMVPIEVDDDIPLTWDPVPVPRPTYTMKARAERSAVLPAAVTPDPAPAVRAADDSRYDARRVAGA